MLDSAKQKISELYSATAAQLNDLQSRVIALELQNRAPWKNATIATLALSQAVMATSNAPIVLTSFKAATGLALTTMAAKVAVITGLAALAVAATYGTALAVQAAYNYAVSPKAEVKQTVKTKEKKQTLLDAHFPAYDHPIGPENKPADYIVPEYDAPIGPENKPEDYDLSFFQKIIKSLKSVKDFFFPPVFGPENKPAGYEDLDISQTEASAAMALARQSLAKKAKEVSANEEAAKQDAGIVTTVALYIPSFDKVKAAAAPEAAAPEAAAPEAAATAAPEVRRSSRTNKGVPPSRLGQ